MSALRLCGVLAGHCVLLSCVRITPIDVVAPVWDTARPDTAVVDTGESVAPHGSVTITYAFVDAEENVLSCSEVHVDTVTVAVTRGGGTDPDLDITFPCLDDALRLTEIVPGDVSVRVSAIGSADVSFGPQVHDVTVVAEEETPLDIRFDVQ
jgi:hypothetical protein